jgi:hypothetical protein
MQIDEVKRPWLILQPAVLSQFSECPRYFGEWNNLIYGSKYTCITNLTTEHVALLSAPNAHQSEELFVPGQPL